MRDSHLDDDAEATLKRAYQKREARSAHRLYDPLTLHGHWSFQEVNGILLDGFRMVAGDSETLKSFRILEVGCGRGGHLIRLAALGLNPERLSGLDLLPQRIHDARCLHPGIEFIEGNASSLPWPDASFDLVLASVFLSSVLGPATRLAIAREMSRVVKPGGAMIILDFVWNPSNKDTIGIPLKELRWLFPGSHIRSSRVLLAPPLGRRVAPISKILASLLAKIPWLCMHRLSIIRQPSHGG